MTVKKSGASLKTTKSESGPVRDARKPGTLVAKAHAAVRNNIISGVHRPGEKLRVEHLKRHYGFSSSTLREALTMLIADKLVAVEGHRGFRVVPVSAKDLIDLNGFRILLEKEAITQSITHGDEEWEAGVVSSFHILSRATAAFIENVDDQAIFDEWERRHRAFHLSLIAAAPSEWIRHFLTLTYQQYERYRHLFLEVAEEFYGDRDAQAEHAAIVDAVLARDAETATRLIGEHVNRSVDEWVGYFDKMRALEGGPAADGASEADKKGDGAP